MRPPRSLSAFWSACLGFAAVSACHARAPQADRPPRVPLTSVGVVSSELAPPDPDDPAGGGSMDVGAYFVTTLKPEIVKCTDKVTDVALQWAQARGLGVVSDPRPGDAVVHLTGTDLGGFLEVTYRMEKSEAYTRARATLWFYTFDASRRDPLQIKA